MISQLHERLDHLVHYSSQLIFVSGKTVAEQQRHLEQFLSQQYDDTEIAYLQLTDALRDAEIRQEICMQLQVPPQLAYKRPLNELLHSLNDFEGPVLVCITQAHLMSQQLLNELWDLVLQSRFANNKQHLNVILFAEPRWAAAAQQAVPARNSNQPLLFSSERLTAEEAETPSVERLLSQHKARFAEHMAKRAKQKQPTLSKNWLMSFLLIMSAVFAMLVTSRFYPHILEPHTYTQIFNPQPINPPSVTVPSHSLAELQELGELWQSLKPIQPVNPPVRLLHNAPLIVSQTTLSAKSDTTETAVAITSTDTQVKESPRTVEETSFGQNMFDSEALLALPSDVWLLQLVGMQDWDALSQYVETYALQDQAWVYQTQKFGGDWYVIVLNIDFATRQDALGIVNSLPPEIIAAGPFAKSSLAVQREILVTDENN